MNIDNAEAGPSTLKIVPPAPEAPPAGFARWRHNLAQFTGLGLSEEEQAERTTRLEAQRHNDKMADDWETCEKYKREMMTRSPVIVFMLKHLELAGCPFPADALQCHPCPPYSVGGFSPEFGVLLCQDRFKNKRHAEVTLAHELIHAFDHCRFKVDWHNLRHHACSEIRAASLSGDCGWWREKERGIYAFNKHHQECVRRRAIASIISNPECKSKKQAEQTVNEVFDSCFKDTRPFDEIY